MAPPTLTAAQQELAIQQQAIIRAQAIVGQIINTVQNSGSGGAGGNVTTGIQAPTTGTWKTGDIVINTAFNVFTNTGWVCVTSGTPGIWKVFAILDNSILNYGPDPTGIADSSPAFNAAFAAISSVGTIVIPTGTYKIATDLTVPVGINLFFEPGASLYISSGIQITIDGTVEALDKAFIFNYQDSTFATIPVLFANDSLQKYVTPYWFGAIGNGTTDEQNALTATFNAFSQQVFIPPGSFQIRSQHIPIASSTSVHLFGAGYESKILCNQDSSPDWPLNGGPSGVYDYGLLVFLGAGQTTSANNIEVDHICFIGNTIAINNNPSTDGVANPNMMMFLNNNDEVNIHDNYFENGQNNVIWQGTTGAGNFPSIQPGNTEGDILESAIFTNNHIVNWGWNAQGTGYTNYNYTLTGPCVQLSARNITMIGNTFFRVANGANCSGRKITITGNAIREFLNQAIAIGDEWNVDTITISGNTIETRLHDAYSYPGGAAAPQGRPIGISITAPLDFPGSFEVSTQIDTISIVGNTIRFETNAQAPWLTATHYNFNVTPVFVSNGGNVYKLHTAGFSSGGPVGTSTTVPTGSGATWLYVEPLVTTALSYGMSLIDAVATVVGNSITYSVGNSQTAQQLTGILVGSSDPTYAPVVKLASNIVRFTGPATNYENCTGIQAIPNSGGSLVTVHCQGNIVQGLGINPPNASGTTQTIGIAYGFESPTPPNSLLVWMNGDISDGGQVSLGGASITAYNVPMYAGVDTRPTTYPTGVATAFLPSPNTLVKNGGAIYECIASTGLTAGGSGPTGNSSSITDGGVTWKYIGVSSAGLFGSPISFGLGALPAQDNNATASFLVIDAETGALRRGNGVSALTNLIGNLNANTFSITNLESISTLGNITSGVGDGGQDQIKIGGQLRANFTGGAINTFAASWTAGSGTITIQSLTGGDPAHYIDIETTGGTPTPITSGTALFRVQLNQAYASTTAFVTQISPRNSSTAALGRFYAIGHTASTYDIFCDTTFTPATGVTYEWGAIAIGTS